MMDTVSRSVKISGKFLGPALLFCDYINSGYSLYYPAWPTTANAALK